MKIGPINRENLPLDEGEGPENKAGSRETRPGEKKDSLELSDDARNLQQKPGGKVDGMAQERLREIKERVARGFYSRSKVMNKIAEKLTGDDLVEISYLQARYPDLFEGLDDRGESNDDEPSIDEEKE